MDHDPVVSDNNGAGSAAVGEPVLTNPHGEEYLYSINRQTFSRMRSAEVFERHIGPGLFFHDTLYLVVGSDSGLLLRYVIEHGEVPGSRYLFIEPDELMPLLAGRFDQAGEQRGISVTPFSQWTNAAEALDMEGYLYMGRVRVIRSMAAIDGYHIGYLRLLQNVQDNYDQWLWSVQAGLGQQVFINAQMANLADNRNPVAELAGKLAGATAVLLAGGPSLDELLPWVIEHQDKLLILAISRVCERLHQVGLVPDAIFVIDPHPASLMVSAGMNHFAEQSLLLHAYHTHPALLQQWSGRHAYIGPRLPWQCELVKKNFIVTSPTVTNTAITTAVGWGVERLILIGVDLCYSADGFTHSQGSSEYDAGPSLSEITTQVATNDGSLAETNHAYRNGVSALHQQALDARRAGCHLVNPVARAARVVGVEYQPAATIELDSDVSAFRQLLANSFPHSTRRQRLEDLRSLYGEIWRMRSSLKEVEQLVEKALRHIRSAFNQQGRLVDARQKAKLDPIERRLDEEYAITTRLAKTYGIQAFTRVLRPSGKEWSEQEMAAWGRSYYSAYRESARQVLELIDRTFTTLEWRIREEMQPADLPRLATQWLVDSAPGRYRCWCRRYRLNPEELLKSLSIGERLLDVERRQLSQSAIIRAAKRASFVDASQIIGKVRMLFHQQRRDELERVSTGLATQNAPVMADLRRLVSGYLAEIDGDAESAIEAYYPITEEKLLEESLTRLCNLLLDRSDLDNARLALEALSHLSPTYIPQYAELQRISGDIEGALEAYARYFEHVPDDTRAMLRLAGLYREAGSTDGVRLVLTHLLEISPEDPEALRQLEELAPE